MRVSVATAARADGAANEDFVAATGHAALVIDGAGTPPGADTGCAHGVSWYSRNLGGALVRELVGPHASLTDCLARAITEVNRLHGAGCDLAHPGSPSATVTTVREHDGQLEYLVLADSPLVLDLATGVEVIHDNRVGEFARPRPADMDRHPVGSPEHTVALREHLGWWREHRNRQGGFWFAGTDPDAAAHALTGVLPLTAVRSFALLSDGASRLVDRFGLLTWRGLLELLDGEGPEHLIRRTRDAEMGQTPGQSAHLGSVHDDASAVYCRTGH